MSDAREPAHETRANGTCGQPAQYGPPGGIRHVSRCGRPVERDGMCSDHLREQEYQREQFDQMMLRASRHRRGVSVHGKGDWCLCGKFVKKGDLHPWDVPTVVEDHLDDLLSKVPLESYGADVQEAVAAFHNGSSHPLLEALAEECRAIEREMRT